MASKVVLGARPKNFKKTLTVDLPEGGQGQIVISYLYRTRKEFGVLVDELTAAAGVPPPKSEAPDEVAFSLHAAISASVEKNAEYILRVADGWDLDAAWSLGTVRQLCDELPGAALAIIDTYRAAITEGRLGN